jgi:hypothetical protein
VKLLLARKSVKINIKKMKMKIYRKNKFRNSEKTNISLDSNKLKPLVSLVACQLTLTLQIFFYAPVIKEKTRLLPVYCWPKLMKKSKNFHLSKKKKKQISQLYWEANHSNKIGGGGVVSFNYGTAHHKVFTKILMQHRKLAEVICYQFSKKWNKRRDEGNLRNVGKDNGTECC